MFTMLIRLLRCRGRRLEPSCFRAQRRAVSWHPLPLLVLDVWQPAQAPLPDDSRAEVDRQPMASFRSEAQVGRPSVADGPNLNPPP